MNRSTKSFATHELLYIIGIIAISFSSIFVRWSDADVAVIAMYRLYLTNLIMLPLVWKYRAELFHLTARQWRLLTASGIMLALHFLLWMASLRLTTVASSTVILTLEPVMVMLGSYWLFRTKANRMMLWGMGIALIGSVVIGSGDLSLSREALLGDVLSLLGAAAVAVHMLIGKQLRKDMSAFAYNFWVFALAATALAFYNIVRGNSFTGYSPKEWGIFLLLAIVPTLFGHYLFNWLLKHMSAAAVSMSVLGEPVIASLLAWALLKEALTGYQLAAGALILFGVWLFIRHGKEE
ncbi:MULTISPECIES: DMT family transporter [Bacillales]|uniref:DMT family transporter n=1 Tax=Bacillales TaxID=1385 RepID=UPI0006A793DD|nr:MULTISPECIES: DMT family transporter [Bacillales]OBZ11010.1 multidrug transporter [Bacillus sp. FJAT-26390]